MSPGGVHRDASRLLLVVLRLRLRLRLLLLLPACCVAPPSLERQTVVALGLPSFPCSGMIGLPSFQSRVSPGIEAMSGVRMLRKNCAWVGLYCVASVAVVQHM